MNLYWELGKEIVDKEKEAQWGSRLIEQLSKDLLDEFQDMKGFAKLEANQRIPCIMGKLRKINTEATLLKDIALLIEESKAAVAQSVNTALTLLYWKVGERINADILQNKRAGYGKQIVVSLTRQLTEQYGTGFSEKNVRRMMQFAELFPDEQNVVSLIRHLSWTHVIALIPVKDPLQRERPAAAGNQVWQSSATGTTKNIYSGPTLSTQFVYSGTLDGQVVSMNIQTGVAKWVTAIPGARFQQVPV